MQRLAGDKLLRNLPLKRGAMGTMLDHGLHPLKAQRRRPIETFHSVRPEGRTPVGVQNLTPCMLFCWAACFNLKQAVGMLVVETIGRIRREHFATGKSIKETARDLKISRNRVRKVLRVLYDMIFANLGNAAISPSKSWRLYRGQIPHDVDGPFKSCDSTAKREFISWFSCPVALE
jgi:hypothetical protein